MDLIRATHLGNTLSCLVVAFSRPPSGARGARRSVATAVGTCEPGLSTDCSGGGAWGWDRDGVLGGAALAVPDPEDKVLCDPECVAALEKVEAVTLPSGLKYKEIRVGSGPSPPVGYQVPHGPLLPVFFSFHPYHTYTPNVQNAAKLFPFTTGSKFQITLHVGRIAPAVLHEHCL